MAKVYRQPFDRARVFFIGWLFGVGCGALVIVALIMAQQATP